MRLALIQTGAGLPRFNAQLAAVSELHPDDYALIRCDRTRDWRLFHDRLDLLARGDWLCAASLDVFALELAELFNLLSQLLARGVRMLIADFFGESLTLEAPQQLEALSAQTDLATRLAQLASPARNRAERRAPVLLTDAEIEEIRQLHERGLTARRISQILRRSPKCISALIRGGASATDQASRNHNLREADPRQEYVTKLV